MSDESSEYGLVMPFIVCVSKGGPYDDASFVAGARMEAIRQRCENGENPVVSWEPTSLVDQLDLVAMRYGYTLESIPWNEYPDEWSMVTLERVETRDAT